MNDRNLVCVATVAGVLGLASWAAVSLRGQTPPTGTKTGPSKTTDPKSQAARSTKSAATAKAGTPPRMAWGDPDLQGTWFVTEDIPLERPAANAGKEFLTDA